MSILNAGMGMPLGSGLMYPAGSARDSELAALLTLYKRDVAGTYKGVSPEAIATTVPTGDHVASTKIDGEQWFLCKDDECTVLLSPNGKGITGNDIHVMKEAGRLLHGWTGILAGELYATVEAGLLRHMQEHRG